MIRKTSLPKAENASFRYNLLMDRLYTFSPIKTKAELLEAIKYTHISCFKLCKHSLGHYLSHAGNMGIFCHYDKEYETLTDLRKELTQASDNVNQKYFRLHEPIVFPAQDDIPKTTYAYLYIRKPDPYRHHVGDVDFCLEPDKYNVLKEKILMDKGIIKGARVFERPDLDMIELFDPNIDVLAYVSSSKMTERVRVKQSDITKL